MNNSIRTLLPAVGLAIVGTVNAQDAVPEGRWSIGASGWAGASYRTLINIDGSALADRIIDGRNEREEWDVAIGGGFHAGYRLSDRFSLEAGVAYARFGYADAVNLSDLTFGDQIDPRRGFIYNTGDVPPESWRFVDRFHYLELPIGVVMELGQGRWRSFTTLGVAPAFLLAAQGLTVSTYEDGRDERESFEPLEDYASFNLIPYFSTGVTMHPGGRWTWSLCPTFRYGALKLIDAPVSARVYSVSLDLGVRFTL
jgi:hypothetical protein